MPRADELGSQLEELQRRDRRLEQDTATLGTSLRRMQKQYDKINQLNEELLEKYNQLLAGDRSENRKLLTDLEATRLRLLNKEDSLDALATYLAVFEAAGALGHFEAFACRNGPAFYGLPVNARRVRFGRGAAWQPPAQRATGAGPVQVFAPPLELCWQQVAG